MSADPTISAGCATMTWGCATAFARAGCRHWRGSFGSRSRRCARPPSLRLGALSALDEAASHSAAGGDGRRRLRPWPLDARRGVALRGGGAREALEVDRLAALHRATRALRGLQAPQPLPGEARGAVPRCDLPQRQAQGPEGGRALRLGVHRGRRAGPRRRLPRDARVARGLARARQGPDRPRPAGADARRRRRRSRADQGGRAVLACLRPPALLRSPGPQPDREAARVRSRAGAPRLLEGLDEAKDECDAKERLEALVSELERAGFTSAARCLADDLDALVVHLRYPLRHRKRWRSTNLLERTLGEVKRRTKVIGRFPRGELPLARLGRPRPADQQRLQRGQALRHRPPAPLPAPLRASRARGRPRGGGSGLD
jgi:Transposase, Mutator family